mmetsp:Transcript_33781/g.30611  ORF Transcript_33781/g.30611 Transcript_33781/m.30611 type:complete len:82 (-) Transcript_33781:1386-1631(-)
MKAGHTLNETADSEFFRESFCPVCNFFSNFFMVMNRLPAREEEERQRESSNIVEALGYLSGLHIYGGDELFLEVSREMDNS